MSNRTSNSQVNQNKQTSSNNSNKTPPRVINVNKNDSKKVKLILVK
jgi:hypothetical protein